MGVGGSRSLRFDNHYVRMNHFVRRSINAPFRWFLWDVRRELIQRLFAALHSISGSYLRNALPNTKLQCRCCGMPPYSSG
jgi:hypothetical protein